MKRLLGIFLLLLGTFITGTVHANPFRSSYVCVPKIAANIDVLEFHIRDGGPCNEEEEWKKVVVEEDGTVLLYPSEGPLSPEVKKDLRNFRTYHGIIR